MVIHVEYAAVQQKYIGGYTWINMSIFTTRGSSDTCDYSCHFISHPPLFATPRVGSIKYKYVYGDMEDPVH